MHFRQPIVTPKTLLYLKTIKSDQGEKKRSNETIGAQNFRSEFQKDIFLSAFKMTKLESLMKKSSTNSFFLSSNLKI